MADAASDSDPATGEQPGPVTDQDEASASSIRISGSHARVEIGADGPSQMGLEGLALMQAVQGSTVLYPSDTTSAAKLTISMADLEGVSYLRTTRGAYRVLYGPYEQFPIGGAKVVRSNSGDEICLVGGGVTVHECLAAADQLAARGRRARVVDAYSIKPMDPANLLEACEETNGRLVVVEDHHLEGGLGAAVLQALAMAEGPRTKLAHLAGRPLPMSGSSAELLDFEGLSSHHIAAAALALLGRA